MNCPKCNRENEEGAIFCRHCGSSMNPVSEKESKTSSVLILVWIVLVGIFSIASTLYTKFVDDWYEGGSMMVYIGISMIHNVIMIIPAFAIKDKTLRIIGVILMACLVLWWLSQNIMWAMGS